MYLSIETIYSILCDVWDIYIYIYIFVCLYKDHGNDDSYYYVNFVLEDHTVVYLLVIAFHKLINLYYIYIYIYILNKWCNLFVHIYKIDFSH